MTATLPGRSAAAARLGAWIEAGVPLVTVWGLAGMGKSALVRSVVEGRDATWLDARGLPAASLRLPGAGDVVVWDGVSLAAASEALGSPGASWQGTVVITARGRLQLEAERALELGPLSDEAGAEVVQEALADSAIVLDPEACGRIATHLDGIPLALRRAADWIDVMGVEGLLHGDPATWTGRRDAPPHHRTLWTALEDGAQSLAEEDRRVLGRLSVVEGRITADLAVALAGTVALPALRRLRDGAWLDAPVVGELHMLHLVRAFAKDLAGSEDPEAVSEAYQALDAWLLSGGAEAWEALDRHGASAKAWTPHLDDAQAALERALSQEAAWSSAARGLASLLSVLRPDDRLAASLDRAIGQDGDDASLRRARARVHQARGDFDRALADLEHARARCTDASLDGTLLREMGVVHHRARRLDEAARCYTEAAEVHRRAEDARSEAITTANLGAVEHDRGVLDAAEAHYRAAITRLELLGDRRVEGITWSNLSLVRLALGDVAGAQQAVGRARAHLDATGDDRLLAIATSNLGWIGLMDGRPRDAQRHLTEALDTLAPHTDVRAEALVLARRGAARARLGGPYVAQAQADLDRAERMAGGTSDRLLIRTVALLRAYLDLARGEGSETVRRIEDARRAEPDQPALVAIADDARGAVKHLEALLLEDPGRAVCVGPEQAWVRGPHQEAASLERKVPARRVLSALVKARQTRPGVGLDLDALFEAGWPGESIRPDSMRNRVHVTLNQLRGVGLREVLLRGDDGYLLDPDVPLLVADDGA